MPRLSPLQPTLEAFCLLVGASGAAVYPPVASTNRASNHYYETAERFLLALELDDVGIRFQRLSGTTATNWAVIKDDLPPLTGSSC